MKKKLLLFCIPFLISTGLFAQDTTSYLKAKQLKINAEVIGGSFSYEAKVSQTNTMYFEAGAQYGISYRYSSDFGNDYRYAFSPLISIEGRHYYHFKERIAKHKDINNNASNFWFLRTGYTFKPLSQTAGYTFSDALSVMPGWGIQRNLGTHFSMEVQLGVPVNYYPADNSWYVGPGGGFKIGYVFK
ncbi:hypothetical protein BDD43_5429 [Mucilaginibacter gracilis]|uniref:Outer membrane protein with beta-barrel domain n=1 Tax=Mucilaginibacter gracilis TaxID=423350 RepID=A0A495J9K8_9SPHI|nr:hypothetical protein [Mucilaginibacter gracilis]RKR85168.1 hypothetical protein BDD43_5429 [Mucilaginibacter gracilis]